MVHIACLKKKNRDYEEEKSSSFSFLEEVFLSKTFSHTQSCTKANERIIPFLS